MEKNLFNIISQNPLIYTIDNFLKESICLELTSHNFNYVKSETNFHEDKEYRNSFSAIIPNQNNFHGYIISQITDLLKFDNLLLEPLQVQKYSQGGIYKKHFDVDIASADFNKKLSRQYSIIIYLNDDFEGGETFFIKQEIKVKPKTGRALVFQNCINNTDFVHPYSLHQGNEVFDGNKYIINTWSYQKEYSFDCYKKNSNN